MNALECDASYSIKIRLFRSRTYLMNKLMLIYSTKYECSYNVNAYIVFAMRNVCTRIMYLNSLIFDQVLILRFGL